MLHERYKIMWDDEREEYVLIRFNRHDEWQVLDRQPSIGFLQMALTREAYIIDEILGPGERERLRRN